MGFSYAGAALGMGLAGFAKGQSEMYEKKKNLSTRKSKSPYGGSSRRPECNGR